MRKLIAMIAMALVTAPVLATDTRVSIEVGEPGFYGRLHIGNAPPPLLIYPEPIVIVHAHLAGPPIYLHVPPGHARNWKDYCAGYGACGHRVYFVQNSWYDEVYVPHHRKRHGKDKGQGKGKGKGHGKGHD